jgi:hypothetical protein
MTQEEALNILWSAKNVYLTNDKGEPRLDEHGKALPNPKWCAAFVYATLTQDVKMHYSDDDKKYRLAKAGARVLVTMVSRFGDVGIRDDRFVPASNGYYARVSPETLTSWGEKP